ncbi:MAG: dioxygenase [Acidobacteria bacterium RIFCSPLOWO2_02_FULL_65_29]|nr:MAG: dioxygenase [Acidobacteria bacterium RIFCSPLOWO2_02_FULL_65_29]
MSTRRWPTLFIPHGGGPCFFMDPMPGLPPDMWHGMASYLRGIDASLGERPSAILVISGHWEATPLAVNGAERPPLLFDYSGFPEHTYRLTYPVAGSPSLAARVRSLLAGAGFASVEERSRGLDHGVFIPLKVMYPAADVPLVQLSLDASRDAARHLALGRALAPLRDEGVLIVGSGMSYHNLREFFADRPDSNRAAEEFDRWLVDAATDPDPVSRDTKLADWQRAPGARASHPTPEHLLPLHVAVGAALNDPGRRTYQDRLLGKPVSAFQFG